MNNYTSIKLVWISMSLTTHKHPQYGMFAPTSPLRNQNKTIWYVEEKLSPLLSLPLPFTYSLAHSEGIPCPLMACHYKGLLWIGYYAYFKYTSLWRQAISDLHETVKPRIPSKFRLSYPSDLVFLFIPIRVQIPELTTPFSSGKLPSVYLCRPKHNWSRVREFLTYLLLCVPGGLLLPLESHSRHEGHPAKLRSP